MPSSNEAASGSRGNREEPDRRIEWIKKLVGIASMYFAMYIFMNFMKNQAANNPTEPEVLETVSTDNRPESRTSVPGHLLPLWIGPEPFTITVDVVDSGKELNIPRVFDLELSSKNFSAGFSVDKTVDFALPDSITSRNGSLYAQLTLQRKDSDVAVQKLLEISALLPKKKVVKTKLLLGDDQDQSDNDKDDENDPNNLPYHQRPVVPNIYPNVSLGMVYDFGNGIPAAMPPQLSRYFILSEAKDSAGNTPFIYPIVFNNEFWQLNSKMVEMNSTMAGEPFSLHLNLYSTSFFWFQLLTNMDYSFKEQARQQGVQTTEVEQLKVTLLETNPYLLAVTVIVTILHMLFEFLAFKSDISHWKNKKDTVGVSVRSIVANVVMQSIIFLYLIDNNDDTSLMILFTQGMGIFVEAWKINKVAIITFFKAPEPLKNREITNVFNLGIIYVQDRNELSEVEEKTKEYDSIAFKYLYIAAVPLIGAYAVYSVMYVPHKSWYSFIISTLVGSVYAYGFLMLVPSIYINYRLKSVAHMPRKAMIYKFLNTFIDDLFAFVVKMPLLHRLATLRDDIIFLVYIYQTWIYRVDYTRVNEFGQGGDDKPQDVVEDKEVEAEATTTAIAQDSTRRRNVN